MKVCIKVNVEHIYALKKKIHGMFRLIDENITAKVGRQ